MSMIYLTVTDPAAQPAIALMRRAFPDYGGQKFKVRVADGPIDIRSSWEGGSRDYFRFVSLADGRTSAEVPAQSAYDRPIAGGSAVTLPDGAGCVEHSIFCGKDTGLTLIIPASNAAALLPPAGAELPQLQARILIVSAALKNTYGGETNLRYKAVLRMDPTLTPDAWQAASAELKARKLLTAQGAITPDGRNVVATHSERHRLL